MWGEQWKSRGDIGWAGYLTCRAGNCTGSHSPGRCSDRHSGRDCCNTHLSGHCRWHPCTPGCRCRCRNQSHPDTDHGGKDQGHSCRCSPHTTHQWILGRNFTKKASNEVRNSTLEDKCGHIHLSYRPHVSTVLTVDNEQLKPTICMTCKACLSCALK